MSTATRTQVIIGAAEFHVEFKRDGKTFAKYASPEALAAGYATLAEDLRLIGLGHQAAQDIILRADKERDDARSCARYLLSFLWSEPHHLAVALKRWPWLETMEAPE